MKKKFLLGAGVVSLVLAYQNCSMSTHSGSSDALSLGCIGQLKEAYRNTYYNSWFRSGDSAHNCIPCHEASGEAGPSRAFATGDFEEAFKVFYETIGRAKVEGNGTNINHRPPHTGPQNSAYISSAKSTWDAAEAAVAACKGSTEVLTIKKALPANVYSTTPTDAATWPIVSWDLDNDVAVPAMANKFHFTFAMEVRRYMDTSTPPKPIGYQFRNPIITVKSSGGAAPTYRVQGILMDYNGSPYLSMTAYGLKDVVVNSTTGFNLACKEAFAAAVTESQTVAQTDEFAVRFSVVEDGTGKTLSIGGASCNGGGTVPTTVRFADLQSANPTTGVFARACNSCHNANNSQGGLNITNYTAARNVATTIRSRMNNSANPMPPGGILSASDRAVVDVWVNNGTPQ